MKRKNWIWGIMLLIMGVLVHQGDYELEPSKTYYKEVNSEVQEDLELIPCGKLIGVKVDMKGIGVAGVGSFESRGKEYMPCKELIYAGDVIYKVNGQVVDDKEDFEKRIRNSRGKRLNLTIMRKGEEKQIQVTPVYDDEEEQYYLGLWIKDDMQGVGTLTYYNPKTMVYGALGHAITDPELKSVFPLREGEIMSAQLKCITKGEKGKPGYILGAIDYTSEDALGSISVNTPQGIYGQLKAPLDIKNGYHALPVANKKEVKEGKATILADVRGKGIESYEIYIHKVAYYSKEPTKGMVIEIIDPKLLKITNGIIQGMSGSPILQNGKLIGAVTHVFVQQPTKGYGIFIENMINSEK